MMQLTLFGFAVNYDVRHIATLIVDQDRSRESREYVASLRATNFLDITETSQNPEDVAPEMRSGRVRVAVVIPPNFSKQWGTANPPQIRAYFDGSDISVSNPAKSAFTKPPTSGKVDVDIRQTVLYNPEARSAVYTVPGLICVILQMVTVTLTSFSLVKERESGTLDQLMVTPISSVSLMLGKILPYAVLSSVEFLFVSFVARIVFNVPFLGNFFLLAILAVVFIVAALGMGLLISTLAQNQAQALQFSFLTMLPSILLSGYIAPRETLPGILSVLSMAFPVTYFIAIARAIMVRGAGLSEIWPYVVGMVAIGVALLTLAIRRFKKNLG